MPDLSAPLLIRAQLAREAPMQAPLRWAFAASLCGFFVKRFKFLGFRVLGFRASGFRALGFRV